MKLGEAHELTRVYGDTWDGMVAICGRHRYDGTGLPTELADYVDDARVHVMLAMSCLPDALEAVQSPEELMDVCLIREDVECVLQAFSEVQIDGDIDKKLEDLSKRFLDAGWLMNSERLAFTNAHDPTSWWTQWAE